MIDWVISLYVIHPFFDQKQDANVAWYLLDVHNISAVVIVELNNFLHTLYN